MREKNPLESDSHGSPELERTPNPIVQLDELIPGANTRGLLSPEAAFRDPRVRALDSRREHESDVGSEYAKILYRPLNSENAKDASKQEMIREALKFFRNQIVVDLGCGGSPFGLRIAEAAEARGCVEVEKYRFVALRGRIEDSKPKPIRGTRPIPVAIVPEDMLTLLRRLPDNSVSVLASGIDHEIIKDEDKRALIAAEIARVLHPEGAYVNNDSSIFPSGLSDVPLPSELQSDLSYRNLIVQRKLARS